ncbi:tetratricopeptide repeat protein [Peteryoungia aggregata]|uniref:tetratricopeptide repeat protein n=1 Tax=Peteryoungia aggregata TaxID=34013 RepID=UPI0027D85B4D|nr:tetratricopeptide repeat protein [Peteryoungia aggregata]
MCRFSLRLALSQLLVPALLTAGTVSAQAPEEQGGSQATQAPVEQIPLKPPAKPKTVDELLAELKRERNPQAARQIANSAMATWSESPSPTINLLMQWSAKAAAEKRNAAALDFIDRAIILKPDFVGAWNQRATLHFSMGNYKKSVSDIEKVLELEPRHFGAIAGLAGILTERGSKDAALKAWQRYLDVFPADREAQEIVAKLSEELAGQRT